MNAEFQKSEVSKEKLQNGRLLIGLSSAIPGFIKKDPLHDSIAFAPFYSRDNWVKLPAAMIQEQKMEHLPLSFTLKPGAKREKVLAELIDALTAQGSASSKELSPCRRCKLGDDSCVDCYL